MMLFAIQIILCGLFAVLAAFAAGQLTVTPTWSWLIAVAILIAGSVAMGSAVVWP